MLILKRRETESILIDGNVEVSILGIESGGVKLGIHAPGDVKIIRKELLIQTSKTNRRAAAYEQEKPSYTASKKIV